MANADELTHVGMEIIVQGTKLSGEVLLKILESITELFKKNSENRDHVIKDNTKDGQQKIKDLVKKHKEGVMAFDDNVTKEQMNDYVKEFKKLGVDFSVVKNDKDDYSFFFSAKDANVIEKALKNIVEKKNKDLEIKKVNTFDLEKENSVENDLEIEPSDRIKKLEPNAAYDEALVIQENFGLSSNKVDWNNEKFLNHLKEVDPQAHRDFLHLKDLDAQINGEKKITDKPLKSPKEKINMDELNKVETNLEKMNRPQRENPVNNLEKEKQTQPQNRKEKQIQQNQNKDAKPQEYSLRAVKEIDTKLKEDNNKNQDKKRTKELSR